MELMERLRSPSILEIRNRPIILMQSLLMLSLPFAAFFQSLRGKDFARDEVEESSLLDRWCPDDRRNQMIGVTIPGLAHSGIHIWSNFIR